MYQYLQNIVTHLDENKKVYIALGVGVAVGVVLKSRPQLMQITNTVAPVFNNNNSSSVTLGGYMTKLVKCNETGEITETVMAMAKSAGVSASNLSRHLNGHTDHINGLTYSIIGLGTSS